MLSSPEILQKLIAKLFISGGKCYFSCCGKRAEEVSIRSWSKRKEAGPLLVAGSGLVTHGGKEYLHFPVSLCLRVAKRKSQANCNVRNNGIHCVSP